VIEEGHETYDNRKCRCSWVLNKEGENHLIIPIGMVIIDEKNKLVNTNQIDSSTFAKANRFKREML
jgi:enhancing lycopene biosynthesis protein 2